MTKFMKTGLRLFALCATLLTSLTIKAQIYTGKAQISTGWHYYTNEGAETQWGGEVRLRFVLPEQQ